MFFSGLHQVSLVALAALCVALAAVALWAAREQRRRQRAESSVEEIHAAMRGARIALWRWTEGGYWSFAPGRPEFLATTAAAPPEPGEDLLNRAHPDDADRFMSEASAAEQAGRPFRTKMRIGAADDTERAAELSGRSVGPRRYAGLIRDCSAERRRDAELARNSQLLAQVHDAIVSTDLDGRIETWNAGAEKLYGYEADEAVGRHISLLYFADEQDRVDEQMTAAVLTSGAYEFVGRFRHRSGFPLSVSVRLAVLHDEVGIPAGVVSCSHDVTKQREREEAFQLRARVLESMQEGVCLTDERGVILHSNPACDSMFAGPGKGLVGRRLGDLLEAPDDESDAEGVEQALSAGGGWSGELCGADWERSAITVHARVSSLDLTEGACWVWVLEDITARKLAEEERSEFDRRSEQRRRIEALGVMAGGIAHDFNNLLVSMLGHAELALDELDEKSPARPSVRQLHFAARRAAELTNQILAFSGRRRPRLEPLSLSEAVSETLPLIESSISPLARVEVEAVENCAVDADPGQLRQVIMNLVLNASDALSGREGAIRVRTGVGRVSQERLGSAVGGEALQAGRFAFLEVSDDGKGIETESIDSIFDPFFTTKFTGRGLGLAATLGVVRGHGGAIEVDSQPGQGARFRVLLPVSERVPVAASPGEAPAIVVGSETILLVDDDVGVVDSTCRMLEKWGYRVHTAMDGASATSLLGAAPDEIDLAIVDMVMPGLTGTETVAALRRLAPEIRVLICSGYHEVEAANAFVGHSVSGFLQKPFTAAQLSSTVRAALDSPVRASVNVSG